MILSIVDTFQSLLDNIITFIEDVFNIFPSEISVVIASAFTIIFALYIYRLLR